MITEKTLFILGAGASCPYNYPSGKKLRYKICFEFVADYDKYFYDGKGDNQNGVNRLRPVQSFATQFYKSSNKSIDLFLARNPSLVDIGKYAIVLEILKSESESKFREEIDEPTLDWYSYLFDRFTDTFLDKENFKISDNKVSFITFNYDRSLEQFLFESLLNSFEGIKGSDAAMEINKIPIIHVYGKVAPLPWEADHNTITYQEHITQYNVGFSTDNIRIINESLEDKVSVTTRELISNAKRIFFLGFGYARENLQILNFPNVIKEDQKIFGTGLGLSPREIEDRKQEFFYRGATQSTNILIEEKFDSLTLLKEYL